MKFFYKQKKEATGRTVEDKMYIISTHNGEMDILYINETAAFIWNSIKSKKTIDEIAKLLTSDYDIELKEARQDVKDIINYFLKHNIIDEI